MSRQKKEVIYWACDFETTVWGKTLEKERGRKQDRTEVWSAAYTKLYDTSEKVVIRQSIRDFLEDFYDMPGTNVLYFHNLSFDGSFIIDFLLREGYKFFYGKDKDMISGTFTTCISDMGQWYWIKIKHNKTILEIRNSLKLMPSSLARIGKSFGTKHQKLDMDYEGDRHAYCDITPEERDYIKNDVLLLKEALEMMFDEGHKKLTIGSCCLSEFKCTYDKVEYGKLFPDLRESPVDYDYTNSWNEWEYVHRSYHGGWCYVNPKYAHRIINLGLVFDVNSLYPSMMHGISGNKYPFGCGTYGIGDVPENIKHSDNKYYFIRVRCRFKLKDKCFPWLHIRNKPYYKSNENLYTSDVRYKGQYFRYILNPDGTIEDTKQELTFTCTDWELFQKTYEIYDLEILDHIWYWARVGMFDEYINKYKELKMKSKGFRRELAKLFLNNLYGKFAMSDNSSYKEPYIDKETDTVHFILHEEHEKKVGYIPVGSAITSYALNFTVRHAMANYDRFCYADTDSIHIQGTEKPEMVVEHPTEFCCWKCEGLFDFAYYERQKMYAEHIIEKDGKPCEPDLQIKCAGMSEQAKRAFIEGGHAISDLSVGLKLDDCNLKAERVPGGIILRNKEFKVRKTVDKKVTPML